MIGNSATSHVISSHRSLKIDACHDVGRAKKRDNDEFRSPLVDFQLQFAVQLTALAMMSSHSSFGVETSPQPSHSHLI